MAGISRQGRRRIVVRLVFAVLILPAAAWAIGVPWAFSLLIAGLGAAAVGIAALPPMTAESEWPRIPPPPVDGGRREVMSLSWMLTSRHHGVDPAAMRRLRAIARRRLAVHGIDLDSRDPAQQRRAAELLGDPAHRILAHAGERDTTHSELDMCVATLESLGNEVR